MGTQVRVARVPAGVVIYSRESSFALARSSCPRSLDVASGHWSNDPVDRVIISALVDRLSNLGIAAEEKMFQVFLVILCLLLGLPVLATVGPLGVLVAIVVAGTALWGWIND